MPDKTKSPQPLLEKQIIFRISATAYARLEEQMKTNPIPGIRSANQFARQKLLAALPKGE